MNLDNFQKNIGYSFANIALLKNALTHTSYANEHNITSNEKLEFLGDAVLEFVTSEYLFKNYSYLKEGEMTKVRASVVCEESLYEIANKLNFSDFLYLGKSELASNTKISPAIVADSVEAVIAAMYLDGGLPPVKDFIITNLEDAIKVSSKCVGIKDHKTVLQEKLQAKGEVQITYQIISESGPDHDKCFTAEVKVNGKTLASGTGKSKKSAEMEAANNAIKDNNL